MLIRVMWRNLAFTAIAAIVSYLSLTNELATAGVKDPDIAGMYRAATNFRFADADAMMKSVKTPSGKSPEADLAVINYYWWKLISGENNGNYARLIYDKVDAVREFNSNESNTLPDDMLFYLVSVYAFEARVYLVDHSYGKALSALTKYYSALKLTFGKEQLHPELNLTTGLFYFFIAHAIERMPVFSPVLKTYYKGNKQTGYDMIVKASKLDNEIVSEQATYFLMKINFDIYANYDLCEKYCRKLIARYPANLLYEYYLFKVFLATDQKIKARDQILVIKYHAEHNRQLTHDESTFYTNQAKEDFAKKYN